MHRNRPARFLAALIVLLALMSLACQATTGLPQRPTRAAPTPAIPPTPLPKAPVQVGEQNPDEPVFVTGEIPYTSPFFVDTLSEPFVLLEDQAGFVRRDREFQFRRTAQVIGPVTLQDDGRLTFELSLPAVPQGELIDLDQDETTSGVQVFAVSYWSNTWDDPFLEERDGTGWSTAYASTITDPDRENEITGGVLIVWAPDENQSFPTGFGADEKLFTADDPLAPISAGYNLIDLNLSPFHFYKESQLVLTLNEGAGRVTDLSDLSYSQAFEAMFDKVSKEYPFTTEKHVDWEALHAEFSPRVAQARNSDDFYRALLDFTLAIPDKHIGLTLNAQVFYEMDGGGFGLVLAELSDGKVIARNVLADSPAAEVGIQPGAFILEWDGRPVADAIAQVNPFFGPYSTEHSRRLDQVAFLTRVPPDTAVDVTFQNPGASQATSERMESTTEYESLFKAFPSLDPPPAALPLESTILTGSNLGYIRINTFSADYNLMARLWDFYIDKIMAAEVDGLILDVRVNGGGSNGMAMDFAGYFFDETVTLYRGSYFNRRLQDFAYSPTPVKIEPAPVLFDGPVAVLIGSDCISACEGFAYAMQTGGRATLVGHTPTNGAFGEVGRGQYTLPDDLRLQFPTGRPETLNGKLLIEGVGVIPDIRVPVTAQSAMGQVDAVLQAAIEALQ